MLTNRKRLAMGVTISIAIVAMLPMSGSSGAAVGPMRPAGGSTGSVVIPAHSPTSEDVGYPASTSEDMGHPVDQSPERKRRVGAPRAGAWASDERSRSTSGFAQGDIGPQYSMPFATMSSGSVVFDDGSFAIIGQTFVGTISNEQYTMEVGTLPALIAWPRPGLPANTTHHAKKHRYLSIDASTNFPNEVSIKVEIAEMNRCQNDLRRSCVTDDDCPTVCVAAPDLHSCGDGSICPDGVCIESGPCGPHPDVGLSWYVQQPQTRGADCPNGMCDEEDYYARVGPDLYVSDWKDECEDAGHIPGWTGGCATLHIGACEIVPGVKYNVYACDALTGDPCSEPLAVETTRKPELLPHYGDVAGAVTVQNPCCFTPPDGYTSVIDIGAYLLTLKNWGTTNIPQAHPTWLDLHGPGAGIPPQYIIMVTDLTMILRAFVDIWPWENSIGGLAPGDCP